MAIAIAGAASNLASDLRALQLPLLAALLLEILKQLVTYCLGTRIHILSDANTLKLTLSMQVVDSEHSNVVCWWMSSVLDTVTVLGGYLFNSVVGRLLRENQVNRFGNWNPAS
jgi:hypothetical protein